LVRTRAFRRRHLLLVGCHTKIFASNALAICLVGRENRNWLILGVGDQSQFDRLMSTSIECVVLGSAKCSAYMRTADYFASTGYIQADFHGIPPNKRAIRLLLWHGMPLKGVGLQCVPNPDDVSGHDYCIATSALTAGIMARAFALPADRVIISGEPKTDLVKIGSIGTAASVPTRQEILKSYSRIILYAPTWRETSDSTFDGGNAPSDERMAEILRSLVCSVRFQQFLISRNVRVLINLHPLHGRLRLTVPQPFLDVTNAGFSVENLLTIADVVLTDFSSLLFDTLIGDSHLLLYAPDLVEYETIRPCPYFNIREMFCDLMHTEPGALTMALEEIFDRPGANRAAVERLRGIFHKHRTGSATLRLLGELETRELSKFE
jgi:CDP-glycerol glycerophosphotransferase (TagB/SpsB family)